MFFEIHEVVKALTFFEIHELVKALWHCSSKIILLQTKMLETKTIAQFIRDGAGQHVEMYAETFEVAQFTNRRRELALQCILKEINLLHIV